MKPSENPAPPEKATKPLPEETSRQQLEQINRVLGTGASHFWRSFGRRAVRGFKNGRKDQGWDRMIRGEGRKVPDSGRVYPRERD